MLNRALVAEFVGTFALAFGVSLSVAREFPFTPLVAALTLGLFVYTVGSISGSHLNPAVTIGIWSTGKIKARKVVQYVGVQLLAGIAALLATWLLLGTQPVFSMDLSWEAGLGELMGAFLLTFGVASVVYGRVKEDASGIVVGGSLLLGILVASTFSSGVLNPAVDVALGILSPMYILGAVIGGVLAGQLYKWLAAK